mmetsp:Transcript_33220/g.60909  ORF Transcript_33220/g.60909 Transcript_33220/m.60909 type:complete len:244 (-) Transcript_33220:675-1406(-)
MLQRHSEEQEESVGCQVPGALVRELVSENTPELEPKVIAITIKAEICMTLECRNMVKATSSHMIAEGKPQAPDDDELESHKAGKQTAGSTALAGITASLTEVAFFVLGSHTVGRLRVFVEAFTPSDIRVRHMASYASTIERGDCEAEQHFLMQFSSYFLLSFCDLLKSFAHLLLVDCLLLLQNSVHQVIGLARLRCLLTGAVEILQMRIVRIQGSCSLILHCDHYIMLLQLIHVQYLALTVPR